MVKKTKSTMKRLLKKLALIAILFSAAINSNAQELKPAASGYAPVNGIKVYYEVYGEGTPLILLHGAFWTISMNWGQLIPELAKISLSNPGKRRGRSHGLPEDRQRRCSRF